MAPPTFSQYASQLLSRPDSTPAPLFYSTASQWERGHTHSDPNADDDILGDSEEALEREAESYVDDGLPRGALSLSLGEPSTSAARPQMPGSQLWNAPPIAAAAAFASRLGLPSPAGLAPPSGGASAGRGWKAHESVMPPTTQIHLEHDSLYDDFDDDDSFDGSPPGDYLSLPQPATARAGGGGAHPTTERLLPSGSVYVYPNAGHGGQRGREYRDRLWISGYAGSIVFVMVLAIREWWRSPSSNSSTLSSIFSSLPILFSLSLLSFVAGTSLCAYLLLVRHAMRHVVWAALVGGPAAFASCGVIAFTGSFAGQNGGWKAGVRWFAVGCAILSFVVGRAAVRRRKQVARAIAVGETAATILISNPPLILLCLLLSLLATVVALPFLFILANLMYDSSTSTPRAPAWSPHGLSGWGALATLVVYLWTLAIIRGTQKVTVAGCVGSWYFEREQPARPNPFEVTKASLTRATGPSLGTIIAASFVSSAFESLAFAVRRLKRAIHSDSLPSWAQPLTYISPLLDIIVGWVELFTGLVLSYVGLTGESYLPSAKAVKALITSNQTSRLADSLLVRLVLFCSSLVWGLLAGLVAFLIASSKMGRSSPYFAIVSVLCFAVPLASMQLGQAVVGDTVDALFVSFNLDLQEGVCRSEKVREAFEVEDQED